MAKDNRWFVCFWDVDSYGEIDPELHQSLWFTNELGYDDATIARIENLEVNESILLGMSDHVVKRIS